MGKPVPGENMMRWFFFCEGTIMERYSFVKRAYRGLNDFNFRIMAIWIQFYSFFFFHRIFLYIRNADILNIR